MRKRTKFHLASVNDDGSYQYRTNEPFVIKGEFHIGIDKDGTLHIVQTEYDDSVKYIPVEKKMIDLHKEIVEQQMFLDAYIQIAYDDQADAVRRAIYGYDSDVDVEGE